MYRISSKPLKWLEETASVELQLKNQTYNNGVYSFIFTAKIMHTDSDILYDDEEVYFKVFKELFPNTHIKVVVTATIKFDINENDIIVSDTLFFNMNKLQRYSIEVIDVQIYKSDFDIIEISEVINGENVTSTLMSHSKGKEILSDLKNEEIFFNLIPGYGSDTFPCEYTDNGFEFKEE